MSAKHTTVLLLVLLMATVGGMVRLLRPSLFGVQHASGPAGSVEASLFSVPPTGSSGRAHPVAGTVERGSDEDDGTGPDDREEPSHTGPRLYVVLDDGGHSIDQLRAFIPFRGVFTVAVLPGLKDSRRVLRMVNALGHEAMLHQPMEAVGGNDPGPGAILTSHDDARIRRTLISNLASMPGIVGINNHMGSKATGDARVMTVVAETLDQYRLFFLDSKTTAGSVAAAATRAAGVRTVERDVFLDNVRDEDAIADQIDTALDIARSQGFVVMIGHVTSPELARVLVDRYAEIVAQGFAFFPLSDLVEREHAQLTHAGTRN